MKVFNIEVRDQLYMYHKVLIILSRYLCTITSTHSMLIGRINFVKII